MSVGSTGLQLPRRLRVAAALVRAGPAILVIAAALLFFREPILAGRIQFEWDTMVFYYPLTAWFDQQLQSGSIPLWSPYLFGGYPIFADGETGMVYPLVLLLLALLPTSAAFVWLRVLHFVLAGLGTLALARVLGLGRFGATIAALTVELGSFFVMQLHHENVVRTAAWLPLVLATFELALRRPGRARAAALVAGGLELGASGLGLHPQILGLNLLALGLFAALRTAAGLPLGGAPPLSATGRLPRLAARLALPALAVGTIAALGLGLSAVQTLPLYELGSLTARSSPVDYGFASAYSLTPPDLLGLLFPYFFRGANGSWSLWPYWESTLHVGATPLILALLALAFVRTRVVALAAALALIGLLLSLGSYTPLDLSWLLWHLPGYSSFRAPGRSSLIVVLALALLAGVGADWLRATLARRHWPSRRGRGLQVALLLGLAGLAALVWQFRLWRDWLASDPAGAEALIRQTYLALRHENPFLRAETVRRGLLQSLDPFSEQTGLALGFASATLLVLLAWSTLRRAGALWQGALLLLVGAQLLLFAQDFHPRERLRDLSGPSRAAQFLAAADSDGRVLTPWGLMPVAANRLVPLQVPNVSGYSSLPPRRYQAYRERASRVEDELLDAWNVRFVARPPGVALPQTFNGVAFDPERPLLQGEAGSPLGEERFRAAAWPTEEVRVVAALADAAQVDQGAEVAEIVLTGLTGRTERVVLRAGEETADTALDHPDLAGRTRHGKAQVAYSIPVQTVHGQGFELHLYAATLQLPTPIRTIEVAVNALTPAGQLRLYGLALVGPSGPRSLSAADKSKYDLVYKDESVELYRNAAAFPRAYVVPSALATRPGHTELDEMVSQPFDPATEVVLEGPVAPTAAAPLASAAGRRAPGRAAVAPLEARIVESANDRVVVDARSIDGGYLVLTDSYYPGWRALVDGEETPVLRANELFRAVRLPPGSHRVVFFFDPASVRIGGAISAGTLALALGVLAWLALGAARTARGSSPASRREPAG